MLYYSDAGLGPSVVFLALGVLLLCRTAGLGIVTFFACFVRINYPSVFLLYGKYNYIVVRYHTLPILSCITRACIQTHSHQCIIHVYLCMKGNGLYQYELSVKAERIQVSSKNMNTTQDPSP